MTSTEPFGFKSRHSFYSHWNPGGIDFSHALTSKLSATGTFKSIPSTLALMAVQRQTAASRSARPSSKAQHLLETGDPITRLTSPRRSTQAPSFKVSLGQKALGEGAMVTGGIGVGIGGAGWHVKQALENGERKRRERMKIARDNLEAAIVV